MRGVAAICALLIIATLSACGGSDATSAATATSSPSVGAEAAKAGRARSFVEPEGDNSIPTFGAEASARVRAEAEQALRLYLRARARSAWRRSCAGLAASVRSQVEALGDGPTCPAAYAALAAGQPASTRVDSLTGKLVSLRVEGRSGFALWIDSRSRKYVMPMVREGGRWRVAQIVPIPYPLDSKAPSS